MKNLKLLIFILAIGLSNEMHAQQNSKVDSRKSLSTDASANAEHAEWAFWYADPLTNNISISDDATMLNKIAGSSNWNAGAISKQYLPPNKSGSFLTIIKNTKQHIFIGLSRINTNESYEEIQFGLGLQQANEGSMQVNVFESGKNIGKVATLYQGDEISITRNDRGMITYSINGKEIYKSTCVSRDYLIVDCSIKTYKGNIGRVKLNGGWILPNHCK